MMCVTGLRLEVSVVKGCVNTKDNDFVIVVVKMVLGKRELGWCGGLKTD